MADEGRNNPRFELKDYGVEIEIQGARVQAKILDISEGGAQIILPQGTNADVNDQITVAFGKGIPDIKGQVRRVGNSPARQTRSAGSIGDEGDQTHGQLTIPGYALPHPCTGSCDAR